ncbi:MerR family transcriptional regulator [Gracilibacillus alcaliphilus]|uniref:MerR family transcriptional regulator n=1 Tax=Gracilibacillus alcaliphilus TaxID=1401441 RepID=UPI00195B745D|nr:MerR family transcriptional regulator [Gracilibacillus alcaliphilus]MBM7678810.1 DNA-binding transcriptional MerR regulator [Gracilibacillus alcaliphilus]
MTVFTIGKVVEKYNIPPYTLRYYETEGILVSSRNSQNRRIYTEDDLKWLEVVIVLKKAGFPLKKIREYADLYHPNELNPDVLKLLKQQQLVLEDSQKKIAQQQKELQDKIAFLEKSDFHLRQCQEKTHLE